MILQRRMERRLSWRGKLFVLILGLAVLPLSTDLANDANADRPNARKRAVRARATTQPRSRIEARLDSLEAAVKEVLLKLDDAAKGRKLDSAPEINKGRTIKDRGATINDAGSTTRPAER